MGQHYANMTRSERLAEIIGRFERADNTDALSDAFDHQSTGGYDNDGSTGPELVDNGIGLGMAALRYDPNAVVFFAFGNDDDGIGSCYYQYGKDEDDAIGRLLRAMGLTFPLGDEDEPCPNWLGNVACDCSYCVAQGAHPDGTPREDDEDAA